jgi:hypothetical protein
MGKEEKVGGQEKVNGVACLFVARLIEYFHYIGQFGSRKINKSLLDNLFYHRAENVVTILHM